MLLALVEQGPATAYELITELDRLFGPSYRASPGGVYPAIAALAAEKLLSATPDGRAKRYTLTAAGRTALDKRRRQLGAVEARTGVRLGDDNSLLPVLDRFAARVMEHSGHVDPEAVERVLARAVRSIESLRGGSDDGRD